MNQHTAQPMSFEELAERVLWLKQNSHLKVLAEEILGALVAEIQVATFPPGHFLGRENTLPVACYILKTGRLNLPLQPGGIVYLKEVLSGEPAGQTVNTLTPSEVWIISREAITRLASEYPEISLAFASNLAATLDQSTAQLAFEQKRQIALRPYLVPKVQRGIVGTSRYAVRLRQNIRKASGERTPVLIFGEPGLGKDNIAGLIHFGSATRKQPLIKINCVTLQANGADLFGRAGGKPGLLDWLGEGTLMLNNAQDLPKEVMGQISRLLTRGEYLPVAREGDTPDEPRKFLGRVILTSEKILPEIERAVPHSIKVPPLRVRKADLATQANYYLHLYCTSRGMAKPQIAPEALRRLQGYDFPGNLSELENLIKRAVIQGNGADTLTEEVFWFVSSKSRRLRLNLLNAFPQLRQFLRSPWYPDRINYGFTSWFFALVVAVLWFGPQTRDQNFGLNLFWAWWWMLILIGYPFVGRVWCAFCPFMIYGEIAQKLSLWLFPRKLLSWQRPAAEQWGGWFLFGLFGLILLWEELWNLQNTAYLSACLLMLITAGAVLFSLIFERRYWCRYLCPIGGMNGLYAKLSVIELRAQQGICSASCTTYQCYKGGAQLGEGQETGGCPIYSHPAQLQDNRDCVLCMTCLKACPNRSVELNLRPPAIELWTTHAPKSYEVCLLFLLLGAVLLHRLPEIFVWFGWQSLLLEDFWFHLAISLVALSLPGMVALLTHQFLKLLHSKPRPFVELAYGYLPLLLGGTLSHYLRLGLTEAGQIVPVTFATFGLSYPGMPVLVAHPAVIAFLQGVTLLVAFALSVFLTQKIGKQPLVNLLPQHLAMGVIALFFWQVIVGW